MSVVKIGDRYYQVPSPLPLPPSLPPPIPARTYPEPSLPPPSVAVRIPRPKEERECRCSEVDEYGRHCIGWCGPRCEGRQR